jgi:hypothetical protein
VVTHSSVVRDLVLFAGFGLERYMGSRENRNLINDRGRFIIVRIVYKTELCIEGRVFVSLH